MGQVNVSPGGTSDGSGAAAAGMATGMLMALIVGGVVLLAVLYLAAAQFQWVPGPVIIQQPAVERTNTTVIDRQPAPQQPAPQPPASR